MATYSSKQTKSFNQTLFGSSKDDIYLFINDWGTYIIQSSSGINELDLTTVLVPLTINMTSSSGNEVEDTLGNTINWTLDTVRNIYAGQVNDLINGNTANNRIEGRGGNDIINGLGGNDTLVGGAGNDTLDGGTGDDTYVFDPNWGSDTLLDASGTDVLDFRLISAALTITLVTGEGNEATDGVNVINFTDTLENVVGGSGNDSITGNSSNNRLEGGAGNDTLDGGLGNDTLIGGLGDDTYVFSGNFGTDTISEAGAEGNDSVNMSAISANATIDLSSNGVTPQITVGSNTVKWSNSEIENITSGSGNDSIRGTNADNIIDAGGGTDTVYGAAGNDTIFGGAGNDTIYGETGNDIINGGTGDDTLNGDIGADTYKFDNGFGSDTIQDAIFNDGAYLDNTIDFSNSTNAITVKLAGSASYDEVSDGQGNKVNWGTGNIINRVIGSQAADTFIGNQFNNWMDGFSGDDLFKEFLGNFGTDTIQDTAGEDTINLTQYYYYTSGPTDATITRSGTDLIIDIKNQVSSTAGNGRIIVKNQYADGVSVLPGANFIEHILFANKEYNPNNAAPTAINGTLSSIDENSSNGVSLGTLIGVDPDSGDSLTYSLTDNAGGRFAINKNTGAVTVANGTLLDYESATSHGITVRVTDAGGLTFDKNITINVTNVNEAPTAINGTLSTIDENSSNGVSLGTLIGVDPDAGDTLTYSLTNNAGGRFAIDKNTGVVTIANGSLLDYESATSHGITVRVTDAGGLTFDKNITINVTNVNEAPTAINGTLSTIDENSSNGVSLGTLIGVDPDAGDTLTYSLTDNAGGRFAIDKNTGVVTVANGSLLDYESATSHGITVRVTDAAGLTFDKNITINVTNVNEAPTAINGSLSTTAENSSNGTVVGTVTGVDPDAGDTLTYSLTDNAGGRFAINSTTGQITVADGSLLDYETATSHGITVRVTDAGGLTFDKNYTVNLSNVNEAPILVTDAPITVNQNSSATITNSFLKVSDVDNTNSELTFKVLSSTSEGQIKLNGTVLSVNDTFTQADIDNNLVTYSNSGSLAKSDTFSFSVSDGAGGSIGSTPFNLNINLVTPPDNKTPFLAVNKGLTLDEGASQSIPNTLLSTTDADNTASQIFYKLMTTPDHGVFKLNGVTLTANSFFTQADVNSGALSYTHDGSETTFDTVSLSISDVYGATYPTSQFNITINPVNDNPELINNNQLVLDAGSSSIISSSLLKTIDVDNTNGQLVYTLKDLPDNGTVYLNGNALGLNGTFTEADLIAGNVTFTSTATKAGSDSFTFTLSDGAGGTITDTVFSISNNAPSINPGGNFAPVLIKDTGLTIFEGASSVITSDMLLTTDADNTAGQLTYTVQSGVGYGTLKLNGSNLSSGSTFTQADLNAGKVSYFHNGGENKLDLFTFNVKDPLGASVPTTAFKINVTPVNDAPVLVNNVDLTVDRGASGTISTGLLKVTDVDNTDAQLTFTVTDAVDSGFLFLGNTLLKAGSTFTQADLNNGLVKYVHDGRITGVSADSFKFSVADGSGGFISETQYDIAIANNTLINTVVNTYPFAVLETGTYVSPNTLTNFFGQNSFDADGNLYSYEFVIRDSLGTILTSATEYYPGDDGNTSYVFNDLGIYTVTLTVTDDSGLSSTTTNVIEVVDQETLLLRVIGSASLSVQADRVGIDPSLIVLVKDPDPIPTDFDGPDGGGGGGQGGFTPPPPEDVDSPGGWGPFYTQWGPPNLGWGPSGGGSGEPGGYGSGGNGGGQPPTPPPPKQDAYVTLTFNTTQIDLSSIVKYEYYFLEDSLLPDVTETKVAAIGGGYNYYYTYQGKDVTGNSNFDNQFDGTTKAEILLRDGHDPAQTPHVFSSYTQIPADGQLIAKGVLTDIYGVKYTVYQGYYYDTTSIRPPVTTVNSYSVTNGGLIYVGNNIVVDFTDSIDFDGSVSWYVVDLNNDGVWDLKQSTPIFNLPGITSSANTFKAGTNTFKVSTIDDFNHLGSIETVTLDVLPNQAPTLSPTASSTFLDTNKFTTVNDVVTLNANALDSDGSVTQWDFYLGFNKQGNSYYFNNTPDATEWKGGFDHNADGVIGIIGFDKYGNVMNEATDYALDGKADGIIQHTFDVKGAYSWKVTATDNVGVSTSATSAMTIADAITVNVSNPYAVNPGAALSLVDASTSSTKAIGAVINLFEFDFNYNAALDPSNTGISHVDYFERKGGYDYNGDGTIDSSEASDYALDGTFDGKFTGNYYYADQTPRNISIHVKATDSTGNSAVTSSLIQMNAAPKAVLSVNYATATPGLAGVLNGRSSTDDQGVNNYAFKVYENGDTNGNGTANELVYSYSENNTNAPDGSWNGSTLFTFPGQGSYKVDLTVTDFFGLTDSTSTYFRFYEGTPTASLSLLQKDLGGTTLPSVMVGASKNIASFSYDLPITFSAASSSIPDGKGSITDYRFDVNNDGFIDYAEHRDAGNDGTFGTLDDVYSAYTGNLNVGADGIRGTVDDFIYNKTTVAFDGSFDGKYTHTYTAGQFSGSIQSSSVQVVSSTGSAATSDSQLWSINQAPVINSVVARSVTTPWFGKEIQVVFNPDGNNATADVQLDGRNSYDIETGIASYKFEWDSNGDGSLDSSYTESRTSGVDGVFGNADDVITATDGSFDGLHSVNFDPKSNGGSPDARLIKLTATDSLGLSTSKEGTIYLNQAPDNNLKTVNTFTGNSSSIFAVGQTISFDSQSSDPDSAITGAFKELSQLGKFVFDFGNGQNYSESLPGFVYWSQGKSNSNATELAKGIANDGTPDGIASYSYAQTGTFNVSVVTFDVYGLSHTSTQTITIVDAPAISFLANRDGTLNATTVNVSSAGVNNKMDFSASSAGAVEYRFDLNGDGVVDVTNSTGIIDNYQFNTAGSYVAKVTAIQANGIASSSTQAITVAAAPVVNINDLPTYINPNSTVTYNLNTVFQQNPNLASIKLTFNNDLNGNGNFADDFVTLDSTLTVTGGDPSLLSNIDTVNKVVTTTQFTSLSNYSTAIKVTSDLGASGAYTHNFEINTPPSVKLITPEINAQSYLGLGNSFSIDASLSTDKQNNIVKFQVDWNNDGNYDYLEWAKGYDHNNDGKVTLDETLSGFAPDGKYDWKVSSLQDTTGAFTTTGAKTVMVKMTDSLGLYTEKALNFTIDNGPDVSLSGPGSLIASGNYNFTTTNNNPGGAAIVKYEFFLDNSSSAFNTETASSFPDGAFDGASTANLTLPGNHTIKVVATDVNGLTGTSTYKTTVNSAPVLTNFDAVTSSVTNQSDAALNIINAGASLSNIMLASDVNNNISSYAFSIDGVSQGSYSTAAAYQAAVNSFDTTFLATGSHQLKATVTDAFGASAEAVSVFIINRNPSPSIDAVNGAVNNILNGGMNFSINSGTDLDPDNNANSFEFRINGGAWSTRLNGVTSLTNAVNSAGNVLSTGTHTLEVRAYDSLGLFASDTDTFTILEGATIDITPLSAGTGIDVATSLINPNTIMNASASITEGAGTISQYSFRIDNGAYQSFGDLVSFQTSLGNLATTALSAGSHVLEVKVTDEYGSTSKTAAFKVNATPSISGFDAVTTSATGVSDATLNLIAATGVDLSTVLNVTDADNNIAQYSFRINSGSWSNFTNFFDYQTALSNFDTRGISAGGSLAEGVDHTLQVKVTDALGLSNTASSTFKINTAPTPVIDAVAGDADNVITPGAMNFSINSGISLDAESNISSFVYRLDGGSWSSSFADSATLITSINAAGNALAAGAHTLDVKATDSLGLSTIASSNFSTNQPSTVTSLDPVVSGGGSASNIINPNGANGYAMNVDLSVTKGDNTINAYQYNITGGSTLNNANWVTVSTDLNGDSKFDSADLMKAINDAGNALTQPGLYTLGVRANDAVGLGTTSTSTFTVNDTPNISFDAVTSNSGSSSASDNLISADGNLSVDLSAVNNVGNIAPNGVTVTINPTVSFNTLQEAANFLNNFNIKASLEGSDPNKLVYGDNDVVITVTDTFGLSQTQTFYFRINSAPVINSVDAVAGDADNIVNPGQVDFAISITDTDNNVNSFQYSTDNGSTWSQVYSTANALRTAINTYGNTVAPENQTINLLVKATDSLGLVANTASTSFFINQPLIISNLDAVYSNVSDNVGTVQIEGANAADNVVNPLTTFSAFFNVTDSLNSITSYEYKFDNAVSWTTFSGALGDNTFSLSSSGLTAGSHDLTIRITDVVGSVTSKTSFTVNDAPKVLTLDAVSENISDNVSTSGVVEGAVASTNLVNPNTDFQASITASDVTGTIVKYEYSVDGTNWTSFDGTSGTFTVAGQTSSSNLSVRVTDSYGLVSVVKSDSFTINTAPVINSIDAVDGNVDNNVQRGDMNFVMTASDATNSIAGYQYTVDGGTTWSQVYTSIGTLTTAINYYGNNDSPLNTEINLQVKAIDVLGLESSLASSLFTVNEIPKAVAINSFDVVSSGAGASGNIINPAAANGYGASTAIDFVKGSFATTSLQYALTASGDTDNWISITDQNSDGVLNGADVIAIANSKIGELTQAGDYKFSVKASDIIGDASASSDFTINDKPTITSIDAVSSSVSNQADATSNLVNPNTAFTGSITGAADTKGGISKYEYSVDGTNWTQFDGSAGNISVAGQTSSGTLSVRVTDAYGLVSSVSTNDFTINAAPTAGTIDANIADPYNTFESGNMNFGITSAFSDSTGTFVYQYKIDNDNWSSSYSSINSLTTDINTAGNNVSGGSHVLSVKAIDSLGLESNVVTSNFSTVQLSNITVFDAVGTGLGEATNFVVPGSSSGYAPDTTISIDLGDGSITGFKFAITQKSGTDNWIDVVDQNSDSVIDTSDLITMTNAAMNELTQAGDYNLKVKVYDSNAVAQSSYNGVVNASLSATDGKNPFQNNSYFDDYITTVKNGEAIQAIQGSSPSFRDVIQLFNAANNQYLNAGGVGSYGGSAQVQWINNTGADVNVIIRSTTYDVGATGNYTLTVTNPNTSANYTLNPVIAVESNAVSATSAFTVNDKPILGGFDAVYSGGDSNYNVVNANTTFYTFWYQSDTNGGINSVEYSVDQTNWKSFDNLTFSNSNYYNVGTISGGVPIVPEGKLYLRAYDVYGAVSNVVSSELHINTAPTVGQIDAIYNSSNGITDADNTGTVYSDNGTGGLTGFSFTGFTDSENPNLLYKFRIDSASNGQGTWSTSIYQGELWSYVQSAGQTLGAGDYTLNVKAIDSLGAETNFATSNFTLTNSTPTAGQVDAIYSVSNGITDSDNIGGTYVSEGVGGLETFTFTGFSDAETVNYLLYQFRIDSATNGEGTWSSSYDSSSLDYYVKQAGQSLGSGDFTLNIKAVDQQGAESSVVSSNFTLNDGSAILNLDPVSQYFRVYATGSSQNYLDWNFDNPLRPGSYYEDYFVNVSSGDGIKIDYSTSYSPYIQLINKADGSIIAEGNSSVLTWNNNNGQDTQVIVRLTSDSSYQVGNYTVNITSLGSYYYDGSGPYDSNGSFVGGYSLTYDGSTGAYDSYGNFVGGYSDDGNGGYLNDGSGPYDEFGNFVGGYYFNNDGNGPYDSNGYFAGGYYQSNSPSDLDYYGEIRTANGSNVNTIALGAYDWWNEGLGKLTPTFDVSMSPDHHVISFRYGIGHGGDSNPSVINWTTVDYDVNYDGVLDSRDVSRAIELASQNWNADSAFATPGTYKLFVEATNEINSTFSSSANFNIVRYIDSTLGAGTGNGVDADNQNNYQNQDGDGFSGSVDSNPYNLVAGQSQQYVHMTAGIATAGATGLFYSFAVIGIGDDNYQGGEGWLDLTGAVDPINVDNTNFTNSALNADETIISQRLDLSVLNLISGNRYQVISFIQDGYGGWSLGLRDSLFTYYSGEALVGDATDSTLSGGSLDDVLTGGSGNEILQGNDGNDVLIGGLGDDTLEGGSGNDVYRGFAGLAGNDTIDDASGSDDFLNLRDVSYNTVTAWQAIDTNFNGYADQMKIVFANGNTIAVNNYFDDTSSVGSGNGYIERILFDYYNPLTGWNPIGLDAVKSQILTITNFDADSHSSPNTIVLGSNDPDSVGLGALSPSFSLNINSGNPITSFQYGVGYSYESANPSIITWQTVDSDLNGDTVFDKNDLIYAIHNDSQNNWLNNSSFVPDNSLSLFVKATDGTFTTSTASSQFNLVRFIDTTFGASSNNGVDADNINNYHNQDGGSYGDSVDANPTNDVAFGTQTSLNMTAGISQYYYNNNTYTFNINGLGSLVDGSGAEGLTDISGAVDALNISRAYSFPVDNFVVSQALDLNAISLISGNKYQVVFNIFDQNGTQIGSRDSIFTYHSGQLFTGDGSANTLTGTSADDVLMGGEGNDLLQGDSGNDLYKEFVGNFGADVIDDISGLSDVLNLSNFNTSDASWLGLDTNSDTFIDALQVDFGNGNSITIQNYFDNTNTDAHLAGAGDGNIEHLMFANNSSVDINTIQSSLI